MLPWILAALIIVPIVEIAVFVEIGGQWGVWPTIGAVFATAIAGSILIRHQGVAVFRHVQYEMGAGRLPARQIFDGLCLLIAGALLLIPGFITDTVGFLLLVPLARHCFMSCIASRIRLRASSINGASPNLGGQAIDGEFTDVTDCPPPPVKSGPEPPAPR